MDLQPNKTDGIYLPITNTRISASEWNQLVGSCMAFITEAGLTPDASDNEQFLNAFKTIAAGLEIVGANTNLSNLTATGEARFTTKADTDLGNVSATGKATAIGWGMPDYSAGVALNSTTLQGFVAPSDGVITGAINWESSTKYLKVNGYDVLAGNEETASVYISLAKGDTLSYDTGIVQSNITRLHFYPLKGAN